MTLHTAIENTLVETAGDKKIATSMNRKAAVLTSAVFDQLDKDEFRKAVYDKAAEAWYDDLGDLTMTHVHVLLDAMCEVLGDGE
jgi:hypothetical protein